MDNMKTNIETTTTTDNNPMHTSSNSRKRTGLKAVLVILSLTALCLSYQAANEAVALYGLLEKVQTALADEQSLRTTAQMQNSETKPLVAGL
jgi:hypothetical protein